jgi:hypothetical protein
MVLVDRWSLSLEFLYLFHFFSFLLLDLFVHQLTFHILPHHFMKCLIDHADLRHILRGDLRLDLLQPRHLRRISRFGHLRSLLITTLHLII